MPPVQQFSNSQESYCITLASKEIVADPVMLPKRLLPGFHVPSSDRLLHIDHRRVHRGWFAAGIDQANASQNPIRVEPRFWRDARCGVGASATAGNREARFG